MPAPKWGSLSLRRRLSQPLISFEATCREQQEQDYRGNSEHTPPETKDFRPRQHSHV
jgi:hypothetical protein